ncbi:MAG: anion permease [Dehalococcoidia bacterium]
MLLQAGASMAVMLAVATPPNAIVFSTGYISPGEMSHAGLWLNFITIILVSLAVALSFG